LIRILSRLTAVVIVVACTTTAGLAEEPGSKVVSLLGQINDAVEADTERLQTSFKDIHRHAELSFMEIRTACIVAKELKALGFDVKTENRERETRLSRSRHGRFRSHCSGSKGRQGISILRA
jgi:hypothetical protein